MALLQDRLVTADHQRGRQLIYGLDERAEGEKLNEDEFVLIINTFAALNVLGIYYQRRYVRRKDALELWASTVDRVLTSGAAFVQARDAGNGTRSWPQLRAFGEDAARYVAHWERDNAAINAQLGALQPNAQDQSETSPSST